MDSYRSFMLGVTKFTYVLIAFLVGIMLLLIFGQIFTRYIFGSTPSFVNELATYILIWISFIGSSLAIRNNKHVSIDIISKRIKSPIAIRVIRSISLIFLILLLGGTLVFGLNQWTQYSATMNVRMTWIIMVTSFGTLLMILQQIEVLFTASKLEENLEIEIGSGSVEN